MGRLAKNAEDGESVTIEFGISLGSGTDVLIFKQQYVGAVGSGTGLILDYYAEFQINGVAGV